jgi:hypothetical protein
MANLETTNVFIDTEVFDASNLNFESIVFKELVRLAQAEHVKVFLTTVTESEVLAHIPQRIHEAFLALEKFRNKGRMLKNVTAFRPVFAEFDEQGAVAEVRKKFENFLIGADVTILDLEEADAEAVFKDYFDKKPPFGEDKKKYEFPDAFAQQALTKWCEDNGCKMYVVGADPDWQSLKGSKVLIPILKLQEFIGLAVKDEAEELTKTVLRLYRGNLPKVEAAIKAEFADCGFYTEDVDGDVNKVTVTRLELGDPQILEIDDVSATISVSVDLDYNADVSYEDNDEGIWDSEDHRWLYRPTKHEEVEESESFEAELTIHFDPENDQSFDVSCSIGKEFSVTVLPTDHELK